MPRRKISQREAREMERKIRQLENASGSYYLGPVGGLTDYFRGKCHAVNGIGARLVVRYENNELQISAVKP